MATQEEKAVIDPMLVVEAFPRKEVGKLGSFFAASFSQAMTAKVQWVPEHAVTDFLGRPLANHTASDCSLEAKTQELWRKAQANKKGCCTDACVPIITLTGLQYWITAFTDMAPCLVG